MLSFGFANAYQMERLGNLIVVDRQEPMLLQLEAADLEELLDLTGWEQLGRIVALNRTARYHNRLNAFTLMHQLAQVNALLHGRP